MTALAPGAGRRTARSGNPSSWPSRWRLAALSWVGLAISTYLVLYQIDFLPHVWEPFFGNGSRYILKRSSLARSFPVPDASLGVVNYLADLVIGIPGHEERWRTQPWLPLLLTVAVVPMAVAGAVLAALQVAVYHHLCTLCLTSAALAEVILVASAPEILAAGRHVRAQHRAGVAWGAALRGC